MKASCAQFKNSFYQVLFMFLGCVAFALLTTDSAIASHAAPATEKATTVNQPDRYAFEAGETVSGEARGVLQVDRNSFIAPEPALPAQAELTSYGTVTASFHPTYYRHRYPLFPIVIKGP